MDLGKYAEERKRVLYEAFIGTLEDLGMTETNHVFTVPGLEDYFGISTSPDRTDICIHIKNPFSNFISSNKIDELLPFSIRHFEGEACISSYTDDIDGIKYIVNFLIEQVPVFHASQARTKARQAIKASTPRVIRQLGVTLKEKTPHVAKIYSRLAGMKIEDIRIELCRLGLSTDQSEAVIGTLHGVN